jgi:type I restriction enzyme R subunit
LRLLALCVQHEEALFYKGFHHISPLGTTHANICGTDMSAETSHNQNPLVTPTSPDWIQLSGSTIPLMHSRNFEFLRPHFRELADLGGFAESYALTDPSGCLVKLRLFAENLVKAAFSHHRLERSFQSNLNDLLADDSFKSITPPVVLEKIHLLRIKGNHAAHGTLRPLHPGQIESFIQEAHELASWFALSIGLMGRSEIPQWRGLPEGEPTKAALQKEKKAALQKLQEQEALMKKLLQDLEEARAQAEAA